MTLSKKRRHQVRVRVTETRDSGVTVKILETGRTGNIRRGEMSWDRRVGIVPRLPQPGEEFDAVILRGDERGFLRLSKRLLTDPWKDVNAEEKYQLSQSVEGEVVNIRYYGVYVQLEPGIDAVIWPKNIPMLREQYTDDIFRVGDRVRGVITELDLKKHKIELSLWDALPQGKQTESRLQDQFDSFESESAELQASTQPHALSDASDAPEVLRRFRPSIPRPQRFLVVDDDKRYLDQICQQLKEEYEIEADGVSSGTEAVAAVNQGLPYGLALIDLKLDGEHGTVVAERIGSIRGNLPILFMSAVQPLEMESIAIDTRKTPIIEKDKKEIVDWIDRLCSGYWMEVSGPSDEESQDADAFIRQLEMAAFARRSLEDRVREILVALRQETRVTQTMVLELDVVDREVTVVAADPPLSDYIVEHSLDSLYYSPVRDVIEDEEEVRVNQVHKKDIGERGRFKNLFPLLGYRSCFGIPLNIPDHVTRYAIFVLDGHYGSFNIKRHKRRVQQCRQAARFLAVAIERSLLLEHMRRYQKRYSQGQLLEDLIHELNNNLGSLQNQVARLQAVMPDALLLNDDESIDWFDKAKDAIGKVARSEVEFRDLVKSYERLAQHAFESVDVNDVAEKIKRQLERTARDADVDIVLDLGVDLPHVRAIPLQLQQVVMNLVLNAIQQIDRHHKQLQNIRREHPDRRLPINRGQVVIQTRCMDDSHSLPVKISVIDTGPGIHWQHRERIFSMGFSNRGGAGLGLFISRNLIESVGGRLSLAASLMLIGSMIVVELPQHPVLGEGKL